MRDRVSIMRRITSIGERGEDTSTFTELEKRWAEFVNLSNRELESARKVYAETTAKARIRKPKSFTISTLDRVRFRGEEFGIGGIIPLADRFEYVDLLLARIA